MNVKYFLLNNKEKKLTLQVWFYSAIYRFKVKFIKPKNLEKYWGTKGSESEEEDIRENYYYASRIRAHVSVSCPQTPWESKCLVQAWTAMTLLKKKGIHSTMYLGVGTEDGKMIAHSWVRCGKMYVTGGDGSGYVVVAKFKN